MEKILCVFKYIFLQLPLLLVFLLAPLVVHSDDTGTKKTLQVIDFQLRWKHQFQFAGYYAAIEKGYFKEEGLDVRLHEGAPGRSPVQEVLAGRAQYAEANSELLYERLKGRPLVALAAIFQHSPSVLLARADADIHSPQDLIGKRIMLMNEQVDADFHAMLLNEGIKADTIKILPSSYDIGDLATGKVAAFNSYLTNEPFFLKQLGIDYVVINPKNYGIDYYSDILFTSEQELKQNPERVKAFRRATLRGWRYAMDHPAELIDLLINKYKVAKSREHLQFEADTMRPLILPDLIEIGHMNPGRWQHMADTFAKVGMVDKKYSLDGFIYDPNPSHEVKKLQKVIVIVCTIAVLISLIVLALFAVQRRLKMEIELRIQTEAALLESRDCFEQLAEQSHTVHWEVDADGLYTSVSHVSEAVCGYRPEELVCKLHFYDLLPENERETVKAAAFEVFARKKPFRNWENSFRTKDGRTAWVSTNGIPIVTDSGKLAGYRGSDTDITERKRAEEALREILERYRTLADLSPDAILVNLEGRFVYANPAAAWILGASGPDEIVGRLAFDFIGEEYHDVVRKRITQVLQQHTATPLSEQRWLRMDGSHIIVEVAAGSTTWEGKFAIQVLLRDITKRRRAEAALQESQDQLKLQFEHMPVGCIVWDNDFIIQKWNPAAEKIFGYTADEAIGKIVYELIVSKDIQLAVKAIWRRLVEKDHVVSSINKNMTKEGLIITCEWINTPFINIDGTTSGVISMVQDITVRLGQEKEQQKIEKLESLGVLAGGIAHDFNNILTAIMGNISFARMFLDDSHKSCKPLVEAEKASLRAEELAKQFLTFARGGEPVKQKISVQHLINEAVSLLLRGSNVRGLVKIPDALHALEADEGQICQMFNNFIINATQAMPDGGTLTIAAHNETLHNTSDLSLPAGSYVKITFADEGCGISENDLPRIFDPYFSTKTAGTGLGLTSAHSIVRRHGGNICVRSTVGMGTTFTIYLPSIAITYAKHQGVTVTQTSANQKSGSILVMDDEEMIRNFTAEILVNLGYQVTTCANGVDAITQYKAARESGAPFSAVIMDLTIPGGMGGKETARQILAGDPQACMIVSSGYSGDPVMSDYAAFGFSGALAKPYNVAKLEQVMSSLLGPMDS